MADGTPTRERKTPGPLWLWFVGSFVVLQLVKRVLLAEKTPRAFDLWESLTRNGLQNLLFLAPCVLIYLVASWWVNRSPR